MVSQSVSVSGYPGHFTLYSLARKNHGDAAPSPRFIRKPRRGRRSSIKQTDQRVHRKCELFGLANIADSVLECEHLLHLTVAESSIEHREIVHLADIGRGEDELHFLRFPPE